MKIRIVPNRAGAINLLNLHFHLKQRHSESVNITYNSENISHIVNIESKVSDCIKELLKYNGLKTIYINGLCCDVNIMLLSLFCDEIYTNQDTSVTLTHRDCLNMLKMIDNSEKKIIRFLNILLDKSDNTMTHCTEVKFSITELAEFGFVVHQD